MLPLILLLAVATLGLVAANAGSDHPAAKPGTGKYCPPAELDLETEQTIDRTLLGSNDPAELRELAGAVRRRCARAADLLEAKATALTAVPAPPPSAPPFIPPPAVVPPFFTPPGDIVPPPSPVIPTPPPTFTPPAPAAPPAPTFTPPAPPADPTAPGITQDGRFDPGIVPGLPKPAGRSATLNRSIQSKLVAFYAHTDVAYPNGATRLDPRRQLAATGPDEGSMSFAANQVDGKWGALSQLALWTFQRFVNSQLGGGLTEDGLPGPNSEGALAQYLRDHAIAA